MILKHAIEAARLAFAYRAKFQKDFLIDLIGYRRYGHNEGDEPAFTQPLMYKKIEAHPTVRELWANTLTQKQNDSTFRSGGNGSSTNGRNCSKCWKN